MNNRNTVICWALAAMGCALSLLVIFNLDVFSWDESHHAFFGTLIYKDILRADINGFFSDTGKQGWFQPFHSYLNALFFLMFGRSYFSARFSSLFMYLMLFVIIRRYCVDHFKEHKDTIALISAFLLATSPYMVLFASLNMQEMMGAALILASMFYYLRMIKNEKPSGHIVIGLLISVVLLSKYHFGLLLGAAMFLIELSRIFDKNSIAIGSKRFLKNIGSMFLGFAPLTALWFLTPPVERKIGLLFYRAAVQGVETGTAGLGLIYRAQFYIKSIISSFSFSLLIGLFLVFSLAYALKYYKDIHIRALLILVFVFYVFHVSIVQFYTRVFVPVMPAVFLLAAFSAADIYHRYIKNLRPIFIYCILFVSAFLMAGDLFPVIPRMNELSYNQRVQDIDSYTLFGLVKRPDFLFPVEPGDKNRVVFRSRPATKLKDILNYCSSEIPRDKSISTLVGFNECSPYLWYWHFGDRKSNLFTSNDYPMAGKYFWFSDYFISFDLSDDSPYLVEIKDKSWSEPFLPYIQRGWLTLYGSKFFPDQGITAKIYRMKLPF